MTGPDRAIERYVPSSRALHVSPVVEKASSKLRTVLNEVSRLETRRRQKAEAFKSKARSDDINSALLKEAARLEREYPMQSISASQFEHLFDERLAAYDEDRADLIIEQEKQDQLAVQIREANR